jgi:acetylornithine deacetylase/succinyl-diaminopimelate desuccinylase-like protein
MTRAVLDQVGDWVTAHREQAIGEWADWIAQPSVNSDGTGFPAATEYGADLVRRCGRSLPIAEFGDALGIPCYGLPLANADERNHAPNENMEVDRFLRGISGAAGVLLALGGAL